MDDTFIGSMSLASAFKLHFAVRIIRNPDAKADAC